MSAPRDEILQEIGLWPQWRRRDHAGAAIDGESAGEAPAPQKQVTHHDTDVSSSFAVRGAGASPARSAESKELPDVLIQGVHDRGYLPHLKAEGGQYFVTFRLADSLPARILKQLEEMPEKQRSKKTEEFLDAAHGECWLGQQEVAGIVRNSLEKLQGERYLIHAWAIMPNHVHLLIEPLEGHSLSEILHGIKSVSAHSANRQLGRSGEFWQAESYDHLVRSDEDRARCIDYIVQNPVKAGLAKAAGDYRFSSAHEGRVSAGEAPAPQKQVTHHDTDVSSSTSAFAVRGAGASPARSTAAREGSPVLPLDARAAGIAGMDWPQLKQGVADCVACTLHKGREMTVFGVGDEAAEWLFVGEGPGAEEDACGEPFVGQAGKLLDNMLAAIKLKRGTNVYIANVVKCRPPNNRNPEAAEAAQCEAYLHRQIELIRPKLIIALGKVAAVNLLKHDASVASMRGKVHDYRGTPMIVTYHPAYLLRSLAEKAKAWEDLCFAVETMRGLQSAQVGPT